jgi:anti-anti-sigma regulatory factor
MVRGAFRHRPDTEGVVLDLRQVTAMDRPGLGAMLALVRAARLAGATVTLKSSGEVLATFVDEGVGRLVSLE